jgi:lipoprotein-releasing system permease protein
MRFELFVADRTLRSKKRTGFVSFITWISVGGVALGTAVLIIILSVMNGFENEVRGRIIGTNASLIVLRHDTDLVPAPDSVAKIIASVPGVDGVAPFVFGKGLLRAGDRADGVIVKGVDLPRERKVTTVADKLEPPIATLDTKPGELPLIVLGRDVAERLRAGIGDELVLASPFDATATPFGLYPKFRKYRMAGTFTSGLYEYDSSLAFISLKEASAFYRLGNASTGIEVRIHNVFQAESMKEKVLARLGGFPYRINTWIELNQNLFLWMKLEKTGMGIILLLIVLVAAFNIVGVLVMMVMENRREIGILKSMGTSDGSIMSIFMAAGVEIGTLGIVTGTALGLVGSYILDRYPLSLPGDVYFLNSLPVQLEWSDVLVVTVIVFLLCMIATLYPAWKAARMDPVEAIREL